MLQISLYSSSACNFWACITTLLLLLLSRFSRVRLCATPQTAAHQALPSLGFSRQGHWSGLPFPSPMHKVKSENEVAQSCPTLSDPMDCSLPGSSIHGIFQARVLEWGAIAFSIQGLYVINIPMKLYYSLNMTCMFPVLHLYLQHSFCLACLPHLHLFTYSKYY